MHHRVSGVEGVGPVGSWERRGRGPAFTPGLEPWFCWDTQGRWSWGCCGLNAVPPNFHGEVLIRNEMAPGAGPVGGDQGKMRS